MRKSARARTWDMEFKYVPNRIAMEKIISSANVISFEAEVTHSHTVARWFNSQVSRLSRVRVNRDCFMKVKLISIWELICVNISSYSLQCDAMRCNENVASFHLTLCRRRCANICNWHKTWTHLNVCSSFLASKSNTIF